MTDNDLNLKKNKVFGEIKEYLEIIIPKGHRHKFKDIALTKFKEDYDEIQEIKAYLNSRNVDIQLYNQKLTRYKMASQRLIRQIAVHLYGYPK